MIRFRGMVGTVALLGLAACGPSRPKAEEALKAAESVITAQHADAMRFAPDAFRGVMEAYGAARTAYDGEDWAVAIERADEAAARARQLAPAIAEGKAQMAAAWPATQDSVATMLAALGTRLEEIARTGRYPDGVDAAAVGAARAEVDSLTAGLAKASGAFDQGDLSGAVHAAERVRVRAGMLMGEFGLRPRNPHGM